MGARLVPMLSVGSRGFQCVHSREFKGDCEEQSQSSMVETRGKEQGDIGAKR